MSGSSSFEEKLSLLPDDIRQLLQDMDPAAAEQFLEKLIQPTELDFRMLQEPDIDLIKRRTAENSAFGFLSADVDITWQELQKPGYIALGAFDQQEEGGAEVPVAFVIAEVSRLDAIQEFYWELEDTPLPPPAADGITAPSTSASDEQREPSPTSGSTAPDGGHSSPAPAGAGASASPPQGEGRDMQQLLCRAGWSGSDTIVSVFYVGVDFEYRRQGIGKQLLDLVKEIGEGARARLMWLTVAEWNPNALAFYKKYGFKDTQETKQGKRGKHLMLVYPLKPAASPPRPGKGKGKKKGGKDKGFGAVVAQAAAAAGSAGSLTKAAAGGSRASASSCQAGLSTGLGRSLHASVATGVGRIRVLSVGRGVWGRAVAGCSRLLR